MDSRHHFRIKGAKAEKAIHDLATRTFLTDWCYPNPERPDGKELCDLLVVFDDTALIWQIKDLKVDGAGRYKKSEVDKNLRQLEGARRTLFDLRRPMTLSNPRRGAEQFNPDCIKHVHLISVLMGEGEEPFPFVQEFKSHLLHVFTRDFAGVVMTELDTISDFCEYLRAKESIDREKELFVMGGEENLLGKYIQEGRSFSWMDSYDVAYIDDNIWSGVQARPEYKRKKELDKVSYGWDSLIDRAHEGSQRYEIVARELARPNRFTRRVLGQTFLEAYSEFMDSEYDMIRRCFSLGDMTYCFLITNDIEHPSKRRQGMLEKMCFVARGIPPQNHRVIGIATNRSINNYDFFFLDIPEWTPEHEALKNSIQVQFGIFVAPRVTTSHEDEYPST